jgi:hypothetical protein
MLLHVIGPGEFFGAAWVRAGYCFFGCVDLGVPGGVARGGEGFEAVVGFFVSAGVALSRPICTGASIDIIVVGPRAVAKGAGTLHAGVGRHRVHVFLVG